MKKNKIIMSIIFSMLLTASNSLNAAGPHLFIANSMAATRASRNRQEVVVYPVYEGKVVDRIEMKSKKSNYIMFLIDKDGDESIIENYVTIDKKKFGKSPILNQLKNGAKLKYKDTSFGKDTKIPLDCVLEVDGVDPLIYPVCEGEIVKKVEIKSKKSNYIMFLINNDENTIENQILVGKEELPRYPIVDKLKEGSKLKYKDTSFGKSYNIYLKNILEIDGVETR